MGELDNYKFPPWILDKRVKEYTKEVDISNNEEFSKSAITIGLHGSALLLPSLLSLTTFHLISYHKRHNVVEDSVNILDSTLNAWYTNVQLFGNSSLNSIKPKDLITNIVILFLSF